MVLTPNCRALCCRGAGCLRGIGTYLPGTVLQGLRLFKRCLNLPTGHCVAGVQAVYVLSEPTCSLLCAGVQAFKAVSEPTCWLLCAGYQAVKAVSEPTCQALCCWSAGCFSGVGAYLLVTVCRGAGCLSGFRT